MFNNLPRELIYTFVREMRSRRTSTAAGVLKESQRASLNANWLWLKLCENDQLTASNQKNAGITITFLTILVRGLRSGDAHRMPFLDPWLGLRRL